MNKLDFAAINQALDPQTVVPQWLPHGYDEVLDQAVYLKRAMTEMDAQHQP